MEEQLKLLENLQQLDIKLHETQEQLAALPQKLETIKENLSRVEAMLEQERRNLSDTRAYKASLEEEIKAEQELLNKTKTKLAQVRTSKEYLAVQREFEANRRATADREQEVGKLDAAIDQFQESIKTHESELSTLRDHVAQEEAETGKQVAELRTLEEEQLAEREKTAQVVRKDVLRKYESISKRRGGLAVVPAEKGVCTGCHMQLPPQLFNVLHRGSTIEQCPACQRIIYFIPEHTDAAEG